MISLTSRYKLLESKLESTLKKSLEIKEEKIAALEARLEESTNLNQQLRQELKTVRTTFFCKIKLLPDQLLLFLRLTFSVRQRRMGIVWVM